jgi:hypothetical protein
MIGPGSRRLIRPFPRTPPRPPPPSTASAAAAECIETAKEADKLPNQSCD